MTQYAWHVHHDKLLEPLIEPIENRIVYIKANKPANEIELRLRLLKLVKGELPVKMLKVARAYAKAMRVYAETRRAHDETRRAYNEAKRAWDKAGLVYVVFNWLGQRFKEAKRAWGDAERAYAEAWRAWDEAERAYNEAERAYAEALAEHKQEILALHEQECPNCPWNGKTIFGRK